MKQIFKKHIAQLMDKLLYFAFLFLGIYFIFLGDVVQKYLSAKTSYAEYTEEMTELPTIVTYLDSCNLGKHTFGEDYKIYYGVLGSVTSFNLTLGENIIDSTFNLVLEHLNCGELAYNAKTCIRITTTNITLKSAEDLECVVNECY